MSVKKRLFWSHILMFALPLAAYWGLSRLLDALLLRYLLAQNYASLWDFQRQVGRAQQVGRLITFVGLVLTLVAVSLLLSRLLLKKINGSLDELSQGLAKLRSGELTYRLPEGDRKNDEFAALRADFNATAAQLQQSVEQVQQNENNRRELLAGVSHDLRSPLTAIRAYTEGLLDGVAETEEDRKQYLGIIRDRARDLQTLVDQLFLFSRMDLGENLDHPERISLKQELSLLTEVLGPDYEKRGLDLTLDAPCEGRVMMDPDTLQRIVSNIAENSLKYKTAPRGRLDIALRETEDYVSLAFTDDGPGVDEEALPHVFDAFYRADPARSRRISGSGLGLAIVSRAVRNMKGRILARNVQPHGLRLEIQLPRERKAGEKEEARHE